MHFALLALYSLQLTLEVPVETDVAVLAFVLLGDRNEGEIELEPPNDSATRSHLFPLLPKVA